MPLVSIDAEVPFFAITRYQLSYSYIVRSFVFIPIQSNRKGLCQVAICIVKPHSTTASANHKDQVTILSCKYQSTVIMVHTKLDSTSGTYKLDSIIRQYTSNSIIQLISSRNPWQSAAHYNTFAIQSNPICNSPQPVVLSNELPVVVVAIKPLRQWNWNPQQRWN